ncbi:MAG: NAD-dependent epimerase/dehydratase family protein [Arcicella sp.]|nr:NAD-dependent epimerase/dehydratase family protein [Arcicella sp.]
MILITGITGLVGSFTARRFLGAGYQVAGLKRQNSDLSLLQGIENQITWHEGDVLDILSLEKAMQGINLVVHTAAIVSFAPSDRQRMFKTNVEGTTNVVNLCLDKKIEKLCFVSSVASLGRKLPNDEKKHPIIEINENATWDENPLNSNYAKTKYLAEMEVWRGHSEGLNTVIVNPSIILGEADWTKSSTQLLKYAYDEHLFYPQGNLNYVDVLDVAEAIFQLMKSEVSGERFILSAGQMTYKDFLAKVAHQFNRKPPQYLLNKSLTGIIWRLEAIRSFITRKAPLITKETALSSSHHFYYQNQKITQTLSFSFKKLDESLERICKKLEEKYS